jgi:hypothetical protein
MTQKKYEVRMEGAAHTIEANSHTDAVMQAKDWLLDGDYDTSEGTVWVHGYLIDLDREVPEGYEERRQHAERIDVSIDPPEPECTENEHDWQAPVEIIGGMRENPGVWGHGGGVVIHDVCLHCGCERVHDTWAQDPETGQQGLRSVAYYPGKYAAQVNADRFKR